MNGIPTLYKGVRFRSRLEARWAAFFDLVGWRWLYEPIDLDGWIPDFWVSFSCGHSECNGSHALLVEVKPYLFEPYNVPSEFKTHLAARWCGGYETPEDCTLPCSAVALFGVNPDSTTWCMVHGAGGGSESVPGWVDDAQEQWDTAGNIVQWRAYGR